MNRNYLIAGGAAIALYFLFFKNKKPVAAEEVGGGGGGGGGIGGGGFFPTGVPTTEEPSDEGSGTTTSGTGATVVREKTDITEKADVKDPSGTGVYTGGGVVSNTGGGGIVSNTGVVPPMVGGIGLGGGGIQDVSPSAPAITTSTRPRVGAIGSRYGGSTSAGSRVDPKFLGFVGSKPKYEFN
jgi:hypothetical protein